MSYSLNLVKINKLSRIFTILIFLNLIILSNQKYNIQKINNYSVTSLYWNISEKYIYYIDIQEYNIGDENVFQIESENDDIIRKLYSFEINETIKDIEEKDITENDIQRIRNISGKYTIKRRLSTKKYYYEGIFKKISEKQKYFVVLFQPNLENYYYIKVDFRLYKPIPNFYIYKNDIDNGYIFSQIFYMDSKIEHFFKFNFINISLSEANILFYVKDPSVSNFYINKIDSDYKKVNLFCIEKNSTNELNHTIYVSFIGEAQSTKLQIVLDYHDIKYFYSNRRDDISLYIERLNCKKDFYIIESYFQFKPNDFTYYFYITPFYGDYELSYYDNFDGNSINDIFKPNKEIKIGKKIQKIVSFFNIIKMSCNTSTLIKLEYLSKLRIRNLTDGIEINTFLPQDRYEDKYINIDDINKKYKLFFEILEAEDSRETTYVNVEFRDKYYYLCIKEDDIKKYLTIPFYYEKERDKNFYTIQTYIGGGFVKLYLISNLYYKNIIEGLTKIKNETKAIAFKLRRDITFDYFIFKAYSHNKEYTISCNYELKIVASSDIENGKVLVGMNPILQRPKTEIILQFNNPYNKYYSRINETETVYLLASFIVPEEKKKVTYPIYTDIRYYYNDKIINIKNAEPKILLTQKEYKLSGDKNFTENNKIILNINKCNKDKTFSLKSYYQNDKNIIGEEEIIEKRTLLAYDNLYDTIKFVLSSNDTSNIINNEPDSNNILQASYYEKGDLYMNYFSLNETLLNEIKLNEDFTISYKDNRKEITFNWKNYIIDNNNLIDDLKVNYSLYILPKSSPINTVCQMSLIPPNTSLINKDKYIINLSKGKYKVGIMASVVNEEFPMVTFYDILDLNVPRRINFNLIIIIVSSAISLIIFIILCIYCKKKSKNNNNIRISSARDSKMISMAKFFGYDEEEDEEILNNDDNENENENDKKDISLIKNKSKDKIKNKNDNNNNNDNFSDKDDDEDDNSLI